MPAVLRPRFERRFSRGKSCEAEDHPEGQTVFAPGSLVAQRLDWIEMSGFSGRTIAEKHSDCGSKQKAAGK
jgi:hypothetical protein